MTLPASTEPSELPAHRVRPPEDTITRIRDILHRAGIFTVEKHHSSSEVGLHSCAVTIGDGPLEPLAIGTFGKGLTRPFALASAYAEFMERLQNGMLFRGLRPATMPRRAGRPEGGYWLFPDEREGPVDQLLAATPTEVRSALATSADIVACRPGTHSLVAVPFFHVNSGTVRDLPVDLVLDECGSNGMCAGNTPAEAICQGIAEILERYVVRRLFLGEMTPPTVPIEAFSDCPAAVRVRRIQAQFGFEVIVKDCSLGLGLPVLGALVVDRRRQRAGFHLGAATTPAVALERCLTEFFQGFYEKHLYALDLGGDPLAADPDLTRDALKDINYYTYLRRGEGRWPGAVLDLAPSYGPGPLDHFGPANVVLGLPYLIAVLGRLGADCYVRDVTYMGFPAYYVYVPGLSEATTADDARQAKSKVRLHRALPTLLKGTSAAPAALAELAAALDEAYRCGVVTNAIFREYYPYLVDIGLAETDVEVYLASLLAHLGRHEPAFTYLSRFLKTKEPYLRDRYTELYALRDYLGIVVGGGSPAAGLATLGTYYGDQAVAAVRQVLGGVPATHRSDVLANCFDCGSCAARATCLHAAAAELSRRLSEDWARHIPDQQALAAVFPRSGRSRRGSCGACR